MTVEGTARKTGTAPVCYGKRKGRGQVLEDQKKLRKKKSRCPSLEAFWASEKRRIIARQAVMPWVSEPGHPCLDRRPRRMGSSRFRSRDGSTGQREGVDNGKKKKQAIETPRQRQQRNHQSGNLHAICLQYLVYGLSRSIISSGLSLLPSVISRIVCSS
jgi:hypothetical protein